MTAPKPCRLDLAAIEASLRAVQANFACINATLATPRDPLGERVLTRLLAGYRYVDQLLAEGTPLLALGQSRHLLELNTLVLCGPDDDGRAESGAQIAATERHFYSKSPGGVEALLEGLSLMDGASIWRRAAAAYVHILSQPQLYIEGNHRTGALIMSWMLAAEGKPPFVLSVDNAKAYFDPSTLVKNARKSTLAMLLSRPKLIRRLAELLKADRGSCAEHCLVARA